jgi:hypothetical protein
VTVTVTGRNTMDYPQSARLWLPDPEERFREVSDQRPRAIQERGIVREAVG